MNKKSICIHGHFYQPPRENTWLESVEMEDSAYPYHDWNDRITAECYGPNSASRILNPEGNIIGIMNNYSRISFNMGATLLSWLEEEKPEIYQDILLADRQSREIYSGHGTAIAQVYNHIIMPLASRRDKITQVRWGIHDFEHRFKRKPEGMWLAEAAVDVETLEILAEHDIRFTILSPRQAARVRPVNKGRWKEVKEEQLNTRMPYLCRLPSGRTIYLFFYNGAISRDIAFEGLLYSGDDLAERFLAAFDKESEEPQLVSVATDGETYGHHHHKGEMALAYCIYQMDANYSGDITIYGEYLDHFKPTHEVQIHENSSWSCVHGVERWRSDCGCSMGHKGWNQKWRGPLRDAMDLLRDRLVTIFEKKSRDLFQDPWKTRNAYIEVILDRSSENVHLFLKRESGRDLEEKEEIVALQLLEMQRHSLLMFTSCGWFFDEISGPETVQVLQYACRAIQLAEKLGYDDIEDDFMDRLKQAPSNMTEYNDGLDVYEKLVEPSEVNLYRVGAHYAISTLFRDFDKEDTIYCYEVSSINSDEIQVGKFRASIGEILIKSNTTWETKMLSFASLHLSDQSICCSLRDYIGQEEYERMHNEIKQSFQKSNIRETIQLLDKHFGIHHYSVRHLFRDEQRKIMDTIFNETETAVENFYREIYQNYYPLFIAMKETGTPLPGILRTTIEFVVLKDLHKCLEHIPVDEDEYRSLVEELHEWEIIPDREVFGYTGSSTVNRLVKKLHRYPMNKKLLETIESLLEKYRELEIPLNLWVSQNLIYEIGIQQFFIRRRLAEKGEEQALRWIERFKNIAEMMGVKFG